LETAISSTETKKLRNQEMLVMYDGGHTLAEIGEKYSLSRQAVQVIFKKMGVSAEGRGARARKAAKDQVREKNTAERIMNSWGLTVPEYKQHISQHGSSGRVGSPLHRYMHQRKDAIHRGNTWNFTFKTWWAMWEESGKWDARGTGQYGMGRVGNSSTPFGPDTCRVAPLSDILSGEFFVRTYPGRNKQ